MFHLVNKINEILCYNYILFIERLKKKLKIFGPRTWCTKNLSVIELYTKTV